jgi:multiple sugar transport system permease protein
MTPRVERQSVAAEVAPPIVEPAPGAQGRTPTQTSHRRRTLERRPIWLIIPAVVLLAILSVVPALVNIYISFFGVTISTIKRWYAAPFLGIDNYTRALTASNIVSGSAAHALWVSVSFSVLTTAIATPIGFLAAITVNHRFTGRGLVRGWFLVPYVIPGVVTAMVGRALFLDKTGLVDRILGATGLASRNTFWLIGSNAFWAMLAVEAWAVWPFTYIMVLSGLNSISTELYDASEVDGAGYRAKIGYIVLPQVRGVLLLSVLLSTIFHLGNFTLPFVMFNMPPPPSVDVLPVDVYYNAFITNQYSLGAAIALVMVIVVLVPGIVYLRSTRLSASGDA